VECFKQPEIPKGIDEEAIEARLSWYYAKKIPMDIMVEGRIAESDAVNQLITDIGMQTIWSMYCSKGKGFEPDYVKNLFERCGFGFITAQKIFAQLQTWRKLLPKDISDDEMIGDENLRFRPQSSVYADNLPIVTESFHTPVNPHINALNELLSGSSRSSTTLCNSQNSDWTSPSMRSCEL
jgi:hypothetical protein